MKHYLLTLLCLICTSILPATAETVEFDFTKSKINDDVKASTTKTFTYDANTSISHEGVTITFITDKKFGYRAQNGTPAYALSFLTGDFEISAPQGNILKSIVFAGNKLDGISASGGEYVTSTGVWTPADNISSAKFSTNSQYVAKTITNISVTYEQGSGSGGDNPDPKPELIKASYATPAVAYSCSEAVSGFSYKQNLTFDKTLPEGAAPVVTYYVDSDAVATISADGTLTFNGKSGAVKVTATVTADDTFAEAAPSYTVTVNKISGLAASFAENAVTLSIDQTEYDGNKLTISGVPEGYTVQPTVKYMIANEDIATIDPVTGILTLKGVAGTVRVTATVGSDDYYTPAYAFYDINVKAPLFGDYTVSFPKDFIGVFSSAATKGTKSLPQSPVFENLKKDDAGNEIQPKVKYSIGRTSDSYADIATVNEKTGELTFSGYTGTAIVTVTAGGTLTYTSPKQTVSDPCYEQTTASYTITVAYSDKAKFDFKSVNAHGLPGTESQESAVIAKGTVIKSSPFERVSMTFDSDAFSHVNNSNSNYQLAMSGDGLFTLTAPEGYSFKKILFNGTGVKNIGGVLEEDKVQSNNDSYSFITPAEGVEKRTISFRTSGDVLLKTIDIDLYEGIVSWNVDDSYDFDHVCVRNSDLDTDCFREYAITCGDNNIFDCSQPLTSSDITKGIISVTIEPMFTPVTYNELNAADKATYDNKETKKYINHLVYAPATVKFDDTSKVVVKAKTAGRYRLTLASRNETTRNLLASEKEVIVNINPNFDEMHADGVSFEHISGDDYNVYRDNDDENIHINYIDPGHIIYGNPDENGQDRNGLWYQTEMKSADDSSADPYSADGARYVRRGAPEGEGWQKISASGIDLKDVRTLRLHLESNGLVADKAFNIINDIATAIDSVTAEEGEVKWFDLSGVQVANPERGIYIRVDGTRRTKTLVIL